jgi:hypothetical protein
MMIFKKAIPRRTFLRGTGTAIALPLLDAMIPAFARAGSNPGGAPALRFGVVYFPNGAIPNKWAPHGTGAAFELSPILQPLAPFRDALTVLSGLDNNEALGVPGEAGGEHPRAAAAFLTCVHPVVRSVEGKAGPKAGVSVDQIIAKGLGRDTQLASLEIGIESGEIVGACDGDSCLYNSTISWGDDTTPFPVENNPRALFERLFGDSDSTSRQARSARLREKRSLLDYAAQEGQRLRSGLGPRDREKLNQYFDAVRDVERRIEQAERQASQELPAVVRPAGIPARFDEHIKLQFDLLALAFQTDLTRVSTFMMGREQSLMTFPEIGVPDPYHPITHHQGDPEKIAKAAKVNVYHTGFFAYFLERLRSTPDGDGSLLDHSIILYGGGLGDGNQHYPKDLPVLLAGGGAGRLKGGRHLTYPSGTPLANLYLRLMEMTGVPVEAFGDSTGNLNLLAV